MDTRFLESFVAVVEHGSMAEAARRLNLTAAAVAQRVKALEAEFSSRLLVRVGRTVQPTETGAAVFSKARQILGDLRSLPWALEEGIATGELRLGAVSTALTGLLPDILVRLSASNPHIELYVAPGTSRDLYQRVVEGDLDAALVVQPPFPLPKTVDWQLVREEPLLVIAPASAAERDMHDLIMSEPFIRYDRGHWGGRLADAFLRQAGLTPRERFELDALEAIAVMVDRGLGVSVVPDWAPPWPSGLSLARWTIPAPHLRRRIGLVWMNASPRLRLVRAFLEEANRPPKP